MCNFAKVKKPTPGGYLSVRSGSGTKFREIDRLSGGMEVYICDERGDLFKVFYSGPDGPCGKTSSRGLDIRKTTGCKSGWVKRERIEVISG